MLEKRAHALMALCPTALPRLLFPHSCANPFEFFLGCPRGEERPATGRAASTGPRAAGRPRGGGGGGAGPPSGSSAPGLLGASRGTRAASGSRAGFLAWMAAGSRCPRAFRADHPDTRLAKNPNDSFFFCKPNIKSGSTQF